MNFVADESVDRQIVDRLRQEGYLVWYVAEMEPGIADSIVLDLANREGALLLTADGGRSSKKNSSTNSTPKWPWERRPRRF